MRVCTQCGYRSDDRVCPHDGMPLVEERLFDQPEEAPQLVGRMLGDRYQIEALIGQGGMGWVFRGTHLVMQQPVALKVMRREQARDRVAVKRFCQEARACSLLRHYNTIKVHDFGVTDDGYPYIVMEYLDGRPLSRVLKDEGALGPVRAVHIATQICRSLVEAHDRGLIHRDLKPANIFLVDLPGERDHVKVLDFGIAKFVGGDGSCETLTRAGMVFGTPRYMSPEQAQAQPLDGRSDLYSLGVILYEMLMGRAPFDAASTAGLLVSAVHDVPPPLPDVVCGASIPAALRALVAALLEKWREDRPAVALDVIERLRVAMEMTSPGGTAPVVASPASAAVPGLPVFPSPGAAPCAESQVPTGATLLLDECSAEHLAQTTALPTPTGGSPATGGSRGEAAHERFTTAAAEPSAERGDIAAPGTQPSRSLRLRFVALGSGAVFLVAFALLLLQTGRAPDSDGPSAAASPGESATGAPAPDVAPDGRAPTLALSTVEIAVPAAAEESRPAAAASAPAPVTASLLIAVDAGVADSAVALPDTSSGLETDGPAKVEGVLVILQSIPPGAAVKEDGRILGRTPFELRVEGDDVRQLTFESAGYRSKRRAVGRADAPEVTVGLEKARAPARRRQQPQVGPKPKPTAYEVKIL